MISIFINLKINKIKTILISYLQIMLKKKKTQINTNFKTNFHWKIVFSIYLLLISELISLWSYTANLENLIACSRIPFFLKDKLKLDYCLLTSSQLKSIVASIVNSNLLPFFSPDPSKRRAISWKASTNKDKFIPSHYNI
jgi:hypothetical protein